MGMAASQVRFLSLQSRKNTIGRQLSTLSNRKTSLARDMKNVSRNFTNALNQTHLKWSNDCGATYHNLSYDMLMKPNEVNTTVPYILTNANNGRVVLNDSALTNENGDVLTAGQGGIKLTNSDGVEFVLANEGENLSYLTLAKMISSFKEIDKDGNPIFNTAGAYDLNDEGVLVGKPAITEGYFIPDAKDFDFQNNLRFQLFELLGLVTKEDVKRQNSYLVELYGSEEAKNKGCYPVGSAWGDYYIALANLEAYEAFTETDQWLALSNTAGNSLDSTLSFNNEDKNYAYNTTVNGNSGDSNITQKNNSATTSHIDFKSQVSMINGYSTVVDYTATSAYDYAANYIGYHTTLSNNGLEYTYNIDSLRETTTSTNNNVVDEVTILNSETEFFSIDYSDYSDTDIRNGLNGLCDSYIDIMRKNTVTDVDLNALSQAKTATVEFFMANHTHEHKTYDHDHYCSEGDAEDGTKKYIERERQEMNGIVGTYGNWHPLWWGGWHRSKGAVGVDNTAVFNTFLTFYEYFKSGGSMSDLTFPTIASSGIKYTISGAADDESEQDRLNTAMYNGQRRFVISQNATDPAGNSLSVNAYVALTTTAPQGVSEGYYLLTNGDLIRSSVYTPAHGVRADGETYYINDQDAITEVAYASGSTTVTLLDGTPVNNVTKQVTDANGNITFYSGTTAVGNIPADATSGGGWPTGLGFAEGTNNYVLYLSQFAGGSHYGFATKSKVNADNDYYEHLKQAVVEAQERISNLEDEIENFYGDKDKKIMDYYDALFLRIAEQGWEEDDHTKNDLYLNNKIQNNDFFLTECLQKSSNTGFNFTAKQATNVLKIFTVHDDSAENEALSEYEAKKSEIQYKENVIDTRMAKLETEQEAINTEMDGIQKVCNDNIEKNFKIFA